MSHSGSAARLPSTRLRESRPAWSRPHAENAAVSALEESAGIRWKSDAFARRNYEQPPQCSVSVKSLSWAFRTVLSTKSRRALPFAPSSRHIRCIQPDVIVTFGPDGAYGHPDHIAISQLTTAAIVCAADSGYCMDDGSRADSLPPHRVAKLYYLAWKRNKWEAYQSAFRKLTSMVEGVERQAHPWPDWAVTTEIDTSACLAHRLESSLLPSNTDVYL